MKKIFLIFTISLFTNFVHAQIFNGRILDSITKQPLEFVNILITNTKFCTYTNVSGNFNIKILDEKDKLLITNIGYKNLDIKSEIFKKNDSIYTFYLKPKIEELEEVIINTKKIKYSWDKPINSERKATQYFGFQFGTENCRFIKNPYKKKGVLKSVTLNLKKIRDHTRQCRQCEVDYIASFCIKFYNYDTINNLPGSEIYNKNLIINPENKNYNLNINIDSLKIPFPINGLCIGVETVNTKYIKPRKTFALIAPFIKFTKANETKTSSSWVRYRDEDWIFKPLINRDKKGKKIQNNNLIIDLTVKLEN